MGWDGMGWADIIIIIISRGGALRGREGEKSSSCLALVPFPILLRLACGQLWNRDVSDPTL